MVRWSYSSKRDLHQIYEYIAQDSEFYAKKVINDIVDRSEYLGDFPNMGRKVEEFDDEGLREVIVYSYRLIYRVAVDGVNIIAIVHSSRNLASQTLNEDM